VKQYLFDQNKLAILKTSYLDRKHIRLRITMDTRAISQSNNVCNVCQARLTGHAKVCLMMRGVNRLLPRHGMKW